MKQKTLDWLRLNNRLRTAILIVGALLFVNLLVCLIFLMPGAEKLKERERRYVELRKRYSEAVMFKKQKEALAGLKASIPTQKDIPLLVKYLVQTAKRLRLSVASVNYDISRPGREGITVLSFSFPAEGTYPSIKQFIYEIETADRLLAIEGMDLGKDQGRVKLQMKLMSYVKGE